MSTASLSYQTVQDYQHVNSSPNLLNCAGLSTCLQQPYLIKLCRIINMSTAALSYQTVQDYQHVYYSRAQQTYLIILSLIQLGRISLSNRCKNPSYQCYIYNFNLCHVLFVCIFFLPFKIKCSIWVKK